ncbi:potassium-transporting ATPase subunit KdpC [Lichenihabitans sp. Uapishka_5]|uniref:potassium-transporting ATPase subunit KdpC n=1 Tax=Lichenihabitans sp. Uapishka_5 TaxID=3037302 RepID=UPI0029E7CFCC|nr:potassium-transporting ATPase subunit KdpC [Lichenihabitans sp. Uapishka_5]MDX7951745.1 potassium-transporting ATPase subunit KdpC [Lichenihabitans sp. Uapishka_5]
MLNQLRPAITLMALFSALTGLAYPLAVTGLAQLVLTGPANGSLVSRDGTVVGSSLIGQVFTSDRYFQGRPSATTAPDPKDSSKTVEAPYNAANSAGSNLGPTSQKLVDRVKTSVQGLGGAPDKPVPADAVTTSASGLDPDIAPAYAAWQVPRVAAARGLPADAVQALVAAHTAHQFDVPIVNVLALNLALDTLAQGSGRP